MRENKNITKTHRGIYGIIKKEGKLLVIKKARGPYTGLYDLPGGSPEVGETPEQTVIREISEETSLSVKKCSLLKEITLIFSDFTPLSGEKGTLAHTGVLFSIDEWEGDILTTADGLDSLGSIWVNIDELTLQNATPFALIGAGKEVIHLADENDDIISTHLRGCSLPDKRYVMIAGTLVYNSKGEILLHKIASHKDWGGKWTYSAAGHVDAGEDYKQAAQRELLEELGIKAQIETEIISFPVERNGKKVAYHHIFKVCTDDMPLFDINEVECVQYFSPAELKQMALKDKDLFFPNLYDLIVLNKI